MSAFKIPERAIPKPITWRGTTAGYSEAERAVMAWYAKRMEILQHEAGCSLKEPKPLDCELCRMAEEVTVLHLMKVELDADIAPDLDRIPEDRDEEAIAA